MRSRTSLPRVLGEPDSAIAWCRLAVACAVAAFFAIATTTSAGAAVASTGPPCGAAGATRIVDQIDDGIAREIYSQELGSTEVSADLTRISDSNALASAVASGNLAAIQSATHAIVYTPVWHIVRLRVLSPTGTVLADVGGPYILAPVTGHITYDGKTVGSFVMSVQDDRGYKKLVTHIAGVPVEIYRAGKPLMGTLPKPPASPPSSGSLKLAGISYAVDAYSVEAFPSGTLEVAVFVPKPTAALAKASCASVALATDASVVRNVASGLELSGHNIYANQQLFISQATGYVHVPVFMFSDGVEDYGTNYLPGSSAPSPPSLTVKATEVSYEGSEWLVSAQRPFPPAWIYVFAPANAAATAGGTGSTGSVPGDGAGNPGGQ